MKSLSVSLCWFVITPKLSGLRQIVLGFWVGRLAFLGRPTQLSSAKFSHASVVLVGQLVAGASRMASFIYLAVDKWVGLWGPRLGQQVSSYGGLWVQKNSKRWQTPKHKHFSNLCLCHICCCPTDQSKCPAKLRVHVGGDSPRTRIQWGESLLPFWQTILNKLME